MLDLWARRKGIQVIGTGDFTHAAWRTELKEKLVSSGDGLYTLKQDFRQSTEVAGDDFRPQFIMTGEISCIYKRHGKVRKVHNLVLLPGIEQAERIAHRLEAIGNLHSDGRPILGLDSRDLLEIALDLCPETIFIPAHIWTPHFSLFGAYSGFDDIEECFGDLTRYIYALETGLSSDPPMNWRLSMLDRFALVSNSDAHSPANLGREANLFSAQMSYSGILQALKEPKNVGFDGTLEFFPEEGKYHCDGHRACKICMTPAETRSVGGVCPVCGGRITVGVLHRVEALADRPLGATSPSARPFERLAPLAEVIAASTGVSSASVKVKARYNDLLRMLGPEFHILRNASIQDLEVAAGPCIAEGIARLRRGCVEWEPGFDGEYGKMHLMDQPEMDRLAGQQGLFLEKATEPVRVKPMKKNRATAAGCSTPDTTCASTALPTSGEANQQASHPYGMNAAQWMAVSSPSPAISVVAGPGTGKTKTLISRIAYLVEECGVSPEDITAVTFTNKAANEMRTRLADHFNDKRMAGAMTIGTFHSICLSLLPEDRRNNPVVDEYQAVILMEEILNEGGYKLSARDVLREISLIKNCGIPGKTALNQNMPGAVFETYCSRLKQYGLMDYDDILLEALQISAERSPGSSFSYLFVDEFQDINEIQYRLIKKWSIGGRGIFIIGDPDQSIYGFRGSDFRYFGRFSDDFSAARQIRLLENYRSTPEIISTSLRALDDESSPDKAGALKPNREPGAKVRVIQAENAFNESLFVAKEINRLIGGVDMLDSQPVTTKKAKRARAGVIRSFADIAVLFRTNRQVEMLEQCLLREGIPYRVAGRGAFLSHPLVRGALAFFKFLLNPADLASLVVCLKTAPLTSVESSETLVTKYASGEKSVLALQKLLQPCLAKELSERLGKYESVIRKKNPGEIIETWIDDHNLYGESCMELLRNTAIVHENMDSFLQNLILGREGDVVRSGQKQYSTDMVSLMTMHAAKGLEFPVVFICGVNDGVIPLRNSKSVTDYDEERRLFYVGMTRARDELLLLMSGVPSPFLANLPPKHIFKEEAFALRQSMQHKQESLFD